VHAPAARFHPHELPHVPARLLPLPAARSQNVLLLLLLLLPFLHQPRAAAAPPAVAAAGCWLLLLPVAWLMAASTSTYDWLQEKCISTSEDFFYVSAGYHEALLFLALHENMLSHE
jgi:hypothetical protein